MLLKMSALGAGTVLAMLAGASVVSPPAPSQAALDARARAEVITGAIDHMRRAYIFADLAEKMAALLQENQRAGAYDGITEPAAFATRVTSDLQSISGDKHLRIIYSPEPAVRRGPPSADERARGLAEQRRRNFGLERVERLDGNVGYLDLRGFSGSAEATPTAEAAMNFVADTDALIFDLRRNSGGSPAMIRTLSSYLFDRVVHLNDFYVRETDTRQQFFTSAEVTGRRYGAEKPVYVLISNRTFSAAEEFTYNLKHLKRATIVGETSGGGAHPGGVRRITDHFAIWLPNGRAINPITGTNWEGVGVEPDLKVPAESALTAAHLDALKKIRAAATDPAHQKALDAAMAAVEKQRGGG